jgi:hypothetical protein
MKFCHTMNLEDGFENNNFDFGVKWELLGLIWTFHHNEASHFLYRLFTQFE